MGVEKVNAGNPLKIPAEAYNRFVDMTRLSTSFGVAAMTRHQPNLAVLPVRNMTGAAQSRFAILGLDVPVFDDADNLNEFQNRPAFDGVVPTTSHAGRWCVLLEDLPYDATDPNLAIGRAALAGIVPAQVNVVDTADTRAESTPGTTSYLTSDPAGSAQILWKQTGTGTKWAIVRIGDPPISSGYRIRFCIVSVNTVSSVITSVVGQVRAALCGTAAVPEEDASGNVTIYDGLGCVFTETPSALVGRQGYAVYMHRRDYDGDACGTTTLPGTGSGDAYAFECRWEVDQLCCP